LPGEAGAFWPRPGFWSRWACCCAPEGSLGRSSPRRYPNPRVPPTLSKPKAADRRARPQQSRSLRPRRRWIGDPRRHPQVPPTLSRRRAADRRARPQQSRIRHAASLRTRGPHRRPLNGLPTTNRRALPTPTMGRPQQNRSLHTGRRWIGGPCHGLSTNSPRGRALRQASPLMVREGLRNRPAGRPPLPTSPSTRRGSLHGGPVPRSP
jgi:hypothetical protein